MSAVLELGELTDDDLPRAGGKACRLASVATAGYPVPRALCVTVDAYHAFVDAGGLRAATRLELARKQFEDMRWEEIWDAGLRIRNRFLRHPIPDALRTVLRESIESAFDGVPVVVRSSAPGEDAPGASFAGLHDSFVNVMGTDEILRHIQMVWASLWSDRALLYRQELGLDVDSSSMAVLVQELAVGERSGIAFSRHPSEPSQSVVEAVYGLNQGLVDGSVEPDRWVLDRETGRVVDVRQPEQRRRLVLRHQGGGVEEAQCDDGERPPLEPAELARVVEASRELERLFGEPQDVEWTFSEDRLVILQSRPITAAVQAEEDDKRPWYLSLHRSFDNLERLRREVEDERLPALEAEARQLAALDLSGLTDAELAAETERRTAAHERWVKIYWSEFIPLAHGIRLFGQVYNDAVRPGDPYEFMDLLGDTGLLGVRRNRRLEELADRLRANPGLASGLADADSEPTDPDFEAALRSFLEEFGTMAFGDAQLFAERQRLIRLLTAMAARPAPPERGRSPEGRAALVAAFLDHFEPDQRERAARLLELGRASYRLRDDDNLILGALKAEVLRATDEAHRRSPAATADGGDPDSADALHLRDPNLEVEAPPRDGRLHSEPGFPVRPRQLVGQPAAPGVAVGAARVVVGPDDLFEVASGEVLVCDAIDPNMTFVVPLASAVVERRGGMLIHGAIIAREYGLPCVTGVAGATAEIATGDRLTVDGFLGIVTVG